MQTHQPRRARTRLTSLAVLATGSLLLSSCLNTSMLVVGETPAPPPPPPPSISIAAVDDQGDALAGAGVMFGALVAQTGTDGLASTLWHDQPIPVTVGFPGFHDATATLEVFSDDPLVVALEPVVVTGRVTTSNGAGIGGVTVQLGDVEAVTGATGAFRMERVVPGEAIAQRPPS